MQKQLGGGEGFIALHLRSGDAIYTYAPYRLYNRQSTNHATPYECALGIINENKDKKILLIGDDVTSMRELYKIANNKNLILVESLRNIDDYTNLELFIYDVVIMSQASKIYGSHSALVRLAYLINPSCEWIHPHWQIDKKTLYKWLCEYYEKFAVLSSSQRAFSCFHLFMQGEACGENLDILLKYLNDALSYDPENDKYRIHIINILLKQNKIDEANEFLKQILDTRFDSFMNLLVSKYWSGKFAFSEVFGNFTSCANENYLYLSYLAARISELTENLKNAIKFYKISEPLSLGAISDNISLLKDKYIEQLESSLNKELIKLKNENISLKKKLRGSAKTRIQSQLTYKLGKAIIENSKSFWGYIRMPYVLSYIAETHANELKNRKEKLPKIETLPDYKEALKYKEHLSYKLGEAWLKGYKTWYKGGLVKFYFEAQKIKKEHKSRILKY